jgi:putative membrane protein
MFLGPWCGQLGLGGWVLMGLFWATFVGLVLWALSRLFAPIREDEVLHQDADDLGQLRAREQMDLSEYRTLRRELTTSTRQRDRRTR